MRSALGVRHGIHRYGITLNHYNAKQGPKRVILDGFAVIFHKSLTYCKNCAIILEKGIIFSQIAMIKTVPRYDLTPAHAQNFLDDDSDPEDFRPWVL